MKKYIIITMSICNINGMVQYVYNKCKHLDSMGYDVYVFSSIKGKVLVRQLAKYSDYIDSNLMYSPYFFHKKNIWKSINKMINIVKPSDGDSLFIEANGIYSGMWAEILAKKLKAKSVIFDLQEKHNYSKYEKDFLYYKLKRHELAGICNKSINMMLPEYNIKYENWMEIYAYCFNVVDDCEDDYSKMLNSNALYSIATITRLNKPYLEILIDKIIEYVTKNANHFYNFIIIGGGSKKIEEKIKKKFNGVLNVNLIITGYLYPIPRSLLKNIDFFISTAGAATVSYNEMRPTIKVNPNDCNPVGIIGSEDYDESKTMYDISGKSLFYYIDLITSNVEINYCDTEDYEKFFSVEVERQLDYFKVFNDEKYYDTYRIRPQKTKKTKCEYLVARLFGATIFHKFIGFLKKIRR